MCISTRIAYNNGVKHHGFSPRTDRKDTTVPKRQPQSAIKRKKGNRLRANDPKRALQLFKQEKKAEHEKRLKLAQEKLDERLRKSRKRKGDGK